MRIRRLTWALITVTAAAGCYIPGGGWTLRTGVDLRTHRKPGCYLEMVDTRWDEWNRVAQMNACCAPSAGAGGGPYVVESSVYAPGAPTLPPPGTTAAPTGPVVPQTPTTVEPAAPVLNDSFPMPPSTGPVSAPSTVPASPPGGAPSEPAGSSAPPGLTPPAPAASQSEQPVASGGSTVPSRSRVISDKRIARTLREIPAREDASERNRAPGIESSVPAAGTSSDAEPRKRSREILFDTPLDPERQGIVPDETRVDSPVTPRANAAARRSSRIPPPSTSPWQSDDNQVQIQGVITDNTATRDRTTAETATSAANARRPSSMEERTGEVSPGAPARSSWRNGFGLFGR